MQMLNQHETNPCSMQEKKEVAHRDMRRHKAVSFKTLIITRRVAETILVILLQFTGLMFSTLTPHASPLWLASGTSIAFIFLRGLRILPGIYMGTFLAYCLAHTPIFTSASIALLWTIQAQLILFFTYRFIGPTLYFPSKSAFITFTLICTPLTALISFALHALCQSDNSIVLSWLADLNGILIIGCAIIAWDLYFPELRAIKENLTSGHFLLFGFLIFSTLAAMFTTSPLLLTAFFMLIFLTIIVISAKRSWIDTIAALFITGMMITMANYCDAPAFTTLYSNLTAGYLAMLLSITTLLAMYVTI